MTHPTPDSGNSPGMSDAKPHGDPELRLSDIRPEARWKAGHVRRPDDLLSLGADCYATREQARRQSYPKAPAEAVKAAKAALTERVEIELTDPAEVVDHAHTLLRALLVFAEGQDANQDDFAAGIWLLDNIAAPALRTVKSSTGDCHARLRALAEDLQRT